jgi:uridylate kinase
MAGPRYKRILLKLSGDFMAGPSGFGVDPTQVDEVSAQIKQVVDLDVEVAIVIGAGNIWRGGASLARGMDRATADYMGMLGTVINAMALQDSLERMGVFTRVQTGIEMRQVAEPYIRRRAIRHLEKGRVVIFGAGTGNPYFTTDTAAALRAMEIGAEILLKATKVDGIYDEDPLVNPHAKRFARLSYIQALNMGVKVMDSTALSLCMDNKLPLMVFKLSPPDSLARAIAGEPIGTIVSSEAAEPAGA